MTDATLRDLERRFHETGAVADEARLLAERRRAGSLSADRLELAAYCGREAALSLLPGLEVPASARAWMAGLDRYGADLQARALIAVARRQLVPWAVRYPANTSLREAVTAAEVTLACPCKHHLQKLSRAEYAAARAHSGPVEGLSALPWHADDAAWARWVPQKDLATLARELAVEAAARVLEAVEHGLGTTIHAEDTRAAASPVLARWALEGGVEGR